MDGELTNSASKRPSGVLSQEFTYALIHGAVTLRVAIQCVSCPSRNCCGFVVLSREELDFLQLKNWEAHLNLTCPFCAAKFEASAEDVIAREIIED